MRFAFPTSVAREIAYYDDAADGRLVMLTDLSPGQTATVLQLPNATQPGEKHAAAAAPHESVEARREAAIAPVI